MLRARCRLCLWLALALLAASEVGGQETSERPKEAKTVSAKKKTVAGKSATVGGGMAQRANVVSIFTSANPMLWPLGLCSVVTLGFALERLVALRRERVAPKDFVNRFIERLAGGKLDGERAAELCKANESPAARVFAQVVRYWGQPAAVIRQAAGQDAGIEIMDLKRNIRVLNGTATLAPLLGLLGTVIGIMESFEAIGGKVGVARGTALAHGISLALVTTGMGLAIAIVSVVMYYYLLNRVDLIARDLDEQTRRVIDLVASEGGRIAADRRGGMPHSEFSRHETRTP